MDTLHIKVHTEARKERVEKLDNYRYEVWVKEPASNNKANERVISIAADLVKVPSKSVKLLKGRRSGFKTFIINNDKI